MATSRLSSADLAFTNTSAATGKLAFNNDSDFSLDKNLAIQGQLAATSLSVSDNASIIAVASSGGTGDVTGPVTSSDNAVARFDGTTGKLLENSGVTLSDTADLQGVKTLALDGSTSGTLTVTPNATTTSHTLTLPAAQGNALSLLKNDGSGNLSWHGPSLKSPILGTALAFWSPAYGAPTNVSGFNLYGNATYVTVDRNRFVRLTNGGSEQGRIDFNLPGVGVNWELKVNVKIVSTGSPADAILLYGNANPGTGSLTDINSTGGIAAGFDIYNGGSFDTKLLLSENGSLVYNGIVGINVVDTQYKTYILRRNGNERSFEVISTTENGPIKYKWTDVSNPTNTHFGIAAYTGASWMSVEVRDFELTVLS